MKKKVLLIDNSVATTGAFKCAMQEAEILREDFDFVFVLPRQSALVSFVVEKGFPCYTLPLREISRSLVNNAVYAPTLLKNLLTLKGICKKERIDVIQVNDFYNLLGSAAKMFGFRQKLITYVRLLPSARPSFLTTWWTRMAVRFSYRVVCVSKAVLREMPANKNIVQIYDPVSFTDSSIVERSRQAQVILLYLANYIPGKGQEHALDALELALKKNASIRLHFAGGDMGLAKNKDFKKRLIEKAKGSGIERFVQFFDFAPDTEKVIKESDVILNFSEAESFSMTCVEASFYGRPVIATKCGGPEEIIVDGRSGFLVDKGNISQMAEAILALAADDAKRIRFGEYGRTFVKKEFNKENFIRSFKEMV